MIEYIKILLLSIFAGATVALPTSSAAHYSLVNGLVDFSDNEKVLGFYFSVISLTFSAVIFVFLRKIYVKSIKSLFSKDSKNSSYKKLMINILAGVLPAALLFIPAGEDMLLIDYFDKFLTRSNFLLTAFACIISALILVISIWYTKQNYAQTVRLSSFKTALRNSVYQLVSYVIPGVSHISSGATNMLMCDIDSTVIVREVYVYLAFQMFSVNTVKVIRYLISDLVVNPVMVLIAVLTTAVMSSIVISQISKVNIRRLFGFFSIYSAVFGVAMAVISFVLR